jgi:hypothetical protein
VFEGQRGFLFKSFIYTRYDFTAMIMTALLNILMAILLVPAWWLGLVEELDGHSC